MIDLFPTQSIFFSTKDVFQPLKCQRVIKIKLWIFAADVKRKRNNGPTDIERLL